MPYTIQNPPDKIKDLPKHAKEIWIAAFNSALAQYKDEAKANMVAWAAVKTKYEQDKDGKWVLKQASECATYYPVKIETLKFEEDDTTKEIKIIPVGEWDHPQYGKIKITEKDIAEFVKNFNDGVRNDIPITEGHANPGETKPAIGWFKKLINKGRDGLWAVVEWTNKGRQLIQDKAYKYFSPEFYTIYEDPETHKIRKNVLVGGALVNKPYFKELPAIVLSEETLNQNNNNNMNLMDVIIKTPESLTDEEKAFLKEHKDELSEEAKIIFASVLDEQPEQTETTETEEPKTEEPKAEEQKTETPATETQATETPKTETPAQEAPAQETTEKVASEKIEASEKITADEGNVLIDKKTLKLLEEKAEQGVRAMEELRRQRLETFAESLTFSEHNANGVFLPKSKNKVMNFIMSLSEPQIEQFKELVSELPKVNLFGEIGSDSAISISAEEQLDKLVKAKMSESNLSYTLALQQVLAEHPEIAEKIA